MAAAEKRPRKLIAGGWAAWMSRPVVPGVSGHLTFSASVEFHIVMSPDELARADLDELGKKKWGR